MCGLWGIKSGDVKRHTRPEVVGLLGGRGGRRSFITSSSVRTRLLGRGLASGDILLLLLALCESRVELGLGIVEAIPAVLLLVSALLALGTYWNLLLTGTPLRPRFAPGVSPRS